MASTTENPNEETIKCVVVGDNNVGKTKLICCRVYKDQFPLQRCKASSSHIPTVWAIDQYRNNQEVLANSRCDIDGSVVSLRLWDTFGDHHKDRRFAYGKADVVVVCFSACDVKSLLQVERFWIPEVRKHCKNIPVFVVACKIDLRFADLRALNKSKGVLSKAIKGSDLIYPDKCRNLVSSLNCPYYETSVMLGFGINDVFENVCRAALIYRRSLYFWNSGLKRVQRPMVQKPLQPPKPTPPNLEVNSCTHSQLPNLWDIYRTGMFCDVAFMCSGDKSFAHKVILSAASDIFHGLFISSNDQSQSLNDPNQSSSSYFETTSSESSECPLQDDLESSNKRKSRQESDHVQRKSLKSDFAEVLSGLGIKFYGTDSDNIDVFTVNMSPRIFKIIVDFCYTGLLPSVYSDNNNSPTTTIDFLTQVIVASQRFDLPNLMKIAAQVINSGSSENTAILSQSFFEKRSSRMRDLFLDQTNWSDIVFKVEDGLVFGHKVLLCAGCDVMNAMLSGPFLESRDKQVVLPDATTLSLKAVLGHIYADDLTQLALCSNEDLSDVISLADRFCLPNLVAKVEKFVVDVFVKEEAHQVKSGDSIGLARLCDEVLWTLESSRIHNAPRLTSWCLHFLCVHYNDACKFAPKLMKSLSGETQTYLAENRWPPVWYIKQQDAYEKALAQRKIEESLARKARK